MNIGSIISCSFWIILLLIIFVVKINEFVENRRERKLGYKVEFVSENVLRGDPDRFAVVYHQNGESEWYYGKIIGAEYILDLSLPPQKEISKGDRCIIKQRISLELKKIRTIKIQVIGTETR